MAKQATLYMVTLREFGSVGEKTVALELTLDPRFKPSHIDLVIDEENRKGFRKGENALVLSSLARASADTVLILCSLRSLGWTLITSNALVANEDEFHRIFYFEQAFHLDDATGKTTVVSTINPKASLNESMDQRNKASTPTSHSNHSSKPKPMSVFKQLAAKRMSGTPTKPSPDITPTKLQTQSVMTTNASQVRSTNNTADPINKIIPSRTSAIQSLSNSVTGSISENVDEDKEDDNFDVVTEVIPKKRSSVSKLFSPMAETEEGSNENATSNPSVISSESTLARPFSSSIGPPVSGNERKKPGRLSIAQLSVGKDFNPLMLAGKKPKPNSSFGDQSDINTLSTESNEAPGVAKRIHNENETDGSQRLSGHTLTRARSFQKKKQQSIRMKGNVEELREKLIGKIDLIPPSKVPERKSPPPPSDTKPQPPLPRDKPPVSLPPPPPQSAPPKKSDVDTIPVHKSSGLAPSVPPSPSNDATRRRSTSVMSTPPPPPPPPKKNETSGKPQPPPPPPNMKSSDIPSIPVHRTSGAKPSERPPPPDTLIRQRSRSISEVPITPPPPPPPPPKKSNDNGNEQPSPEDLVKERRKLESKTKNEEYFAKLRMEEKKKVAEIEEVEISAADLEKKEAAELHETKKTQHYSRLGASFTKSNVLKKGGPGRGANLKKT